MTTSAWACATARRLGLSGTLDFTVARVGQTLHVPCAKGNHKVDVPIGGGLHPDGVAKKMLGAGWIIGRRLTCPDCRPKRDKKKETKPMAQTAALKPATTELEPSDAARQAKRFALLALDDHYDMSAKCYRRGHSDATIAKEAGCSEAVVAKLRDDMYGPVGEPPELRALRDELAAMQEDAQRYLDKMIALQQQATALGTRFAALTRKHGWAP